MKMVHRRRESGQAMIELVVLLVALAAVFLGIVVVCGLADGDIRVFLAARNQAELLAASEDPQTVSGSEFSTWSNYRQKVYDDKTEIVFSPMDTPNRREGSTIGSFRNAFSEGRYSVIAPEKDPFYRNQAHLDNWLSTGKALPGTFRADFVTGLERKNALEAAMLVRAGASENCSEITTLSCCCGTGNNLDKVASAFYALFGVRLKDNLLVDAPGNQVYWPVLKE